MSLTELSPELAEKARNELNEDPETRMGIIEELREKLKQRPDLRFETADKDLIKFLRARKFDLERSFELIVGHYEKKQNTPELFSNYSPTAEKATFESGFNIVFPERDQHGCKVLVFRPGNWDPNERSVLNNFRANIIALDVLLEDEETQINGIVLVGDFRNFGLAQAASMQPTMFRNYGGIIFNCFPIRIKGIHIIEQPKIFSVIYAVVSHFMREKIRKRVVLHGSNIEQLHEYIDKHLVPSDYGGEGQPTDLRAWIKYIFEAEEECPHLWY